MWLWLAAVLFALGSLGDNLLTYKYIVLERRFYEANPIVAARIYTQPLWIWFIYDFIGFMVALALAFGYYRLMHLLSRRDPPWKRERVLRIASKYWVIVLGVAIVRFLPVIHNILVICFGIETPLPNLFYFFGRFLGLV